MKDPESKHRTLKEIRRPNAEAGTQTVRSVLDCGGPPPLASSPLTTFSLGQSTGGQAQAMTWRLWPLCFCFLFSTLCFRTLGQYSLDWSTVDGGGGTSTGGVYSVSGTIGQPDASSVMSGGRYSITGGFWSIVAAVQTPGTPLLTITLSGSSVIISWPLSPGGFFLQRNGNVANAAGWSTCGGTVSTNNGVNSITITPPVGNLFFRLSNP